MWRTLLGIILLLTLSKSVMAVEAVSSPAVDFSKDIQPVFHDRCYSCHGPEKQKNGLRLDRKEDALKGGESGKAIEPGKGAESLLVKLVAGQDVNRPMPPKGERLTAAQIDALRAWIDQGAVWPVADAPANAPAEAKPPHWAFQAPVAPAIPVVKNTAWVRNPIDAFVLARLESEGIAPSPEADRPTLIRRLSLDLLGLPPTPAEVDAFVNDTSANAYERLVNRLLASSHFGERWGRYWLDLAHYADSDGFEKDTVRPYAWRYRQWVIDALNRDVPYDQFITEQVAGDLLPNATTEQRVATGFYRNTLTNKEGGVDQEQYRVEQIVDRVNTTGAAFLGLTVGCAQCHNHKYDPISQKEYYEMFAFFNTGVEKDIPAPLDPEVESFKLAKAAFDKEHANLVKAVDTYKTELAGRLPEWESQQDTADIEWTPLDPAGYLSSGGATFTKLEDKSLLVGGNSVAKDKYTISITTKLKGITGFRIEALTDPSLPKNGPGRADDSNFVLTEVKAQASPAADPNTVQPVNFTGAWADAEQDGFAVAGAFDGKKDTGWAAGGGDRVGVNHSLTLLTESEIGFPEGTILTFTLDQNYESKYTLGHFRILATTSSRKRLALPDAVRQALKTPADQRTPEQKATELDYFGTFDSKMRELKAAAAGHLKGEPKPPATLAQTLAENPTPPKTHIHTRGDFLRPGEEVQPMTLAVLHPFHPRGDKPDRLDLARWLVDPKNPLASRVAVNRVWEHLFGRGIVLTTEDFGTRGDPPTNQALLDWLATEFVRRGGSTKELIQLVVQSAAYRQSSATRPDLIDKDPGNLLIARQDRFRVEAEVTRDVCLAVSGLLNPAVGGPGVRPPMPPGIAELGYAGSIKWPESTGDDRYRRGIYIFFQRTVPYPMLMAFDCPDSNVTCIRRNRSNTPLQALTLLNDPVFVECAQAFGRRILTEGPADETERIRFAFRMGLGRDPSADEAKTLSTLYDDQRRVFQENPEAADKVVSAFKPNAADPVDPADAAAAISLGRTVMNLDEFVTRE